MSNITNPTASPPPPTNPSAIMALATGYWNSAAMLAAVRVGLFDALANGASTAAEVALRLSADFRAVLMLLDACAALDLIHRDAGDPVASYRNSSAARAFLVSGRPGYMGSAILWGADQYEAWGKLSQTILDGKPAVDPDLHLGDDPEQTRAFVLGMNNRAMGLARGVVQFIDLGIDANNEASMLDVGGGPGAYSVLLAGKYPQLKAVVFDLPGIVTVASELIASTPVAGRVSVRPGNAVVDSYGKSGFDAVLFSGVLHQMSPVTIASMLLNAYEALKPGGKVVVTDVMLSSNRTEPTFTTLFSLQMLLTSHEGHVFSLDDIQTWLSDAGFESVSGMPLPPPLPYMMASAVKPV